MKIKTILEQVNGIYYANGPVEGVGWRDGPRLVEQERRIKDRIKRRIVKILRKHTYDHSYAIELADEIIKEL